MESVGGTLVVDSIDELYSHIEQRIEEVLNADYEPVFRKVMNDFEEDHEFYFQNEVAFTGAPWAELSPVTIAAKGHDRILVDTGRLMASLTSDSPDAIREIVTGVHTPTMSFGTSVEYAGYHQTGTEHMPARPVLGITDIGMERLTDDLLDHLFGILLIGEPNTR